MFKLKDKKRERLLVASVAGSALILAGCNHKDGDDMMETMARYQVTVHNLTANQPMSPPAVVIHQAGYEAWTPGAAASVGLEMIAESGASADFLSEADANPAVKMSGASDAGPFMPGNTATVTLEGDVHTGLRLSVAAMLGNTNDGFMGVAGHDISDLGAGDSTSFMVGAMDAGTEMNSESAATVPGPAGGGEAFNAARDDVDFVSVHAGVVTMDDGLATSTLDESHRWDGPVAKITVSRLQ